MGKKGDLSNFERGMVVGAGLSISQSDLSYWDFHEGERGSNSISMVFLIIL